MHCTAKHAPVSLLHPIASLAPSICISLFFTYTHESRRTSETQLKGNQIVHVLAMTQIIGIYSKVKSDILKLKVLLRPESPFQESKLRLPPKPQ